MTVTASPHIELGNGFPGILGLMAFRPACAKPLNELADLLLRGDNSLTRGERELIAAYVSNLNQCNFCQKSHSAFAAAQLEGGLDLVDAVKADVDSAPIGPKMRSLLALAAKVQAGGRQVTADDVARARTAGASDFEIHDAVLIAAAFCMYNRYVDGLATFAPPDQSDYAPMASVIVEHGYAGAVAAMAQADPRST